MTLFISTFQKSFASSPPKEVDSRKYCSKSQEEWQGGSRLTGVNQLTFKNGSAAVKPTRQPPHIIANTQQEGFYVPASPTPWAIQLPSCSMGVATFTYRILGSQLSLWQPLKGGIGKDSLVRKKGYLLSLWSGSQVENIRSAFPYIYFMFCVFQFAQT